MTKSLRISFWWLGIVGFFTLMIYQLSSILLPFVLGMMVAYLLDPVVDRLERRRFSRAIATMLVTVLFFVLFAMFVFAMFPLVSEQLAGLIGSVPQMIDHLSVIYNSKLEKVLAAVPESQIETVQNSFGNLSMVIMEMLTGFADDVFASGGALLNMLSMLMITPIVAFYLLKDWDHILEVLDRLLPLKHAETVRQQLREINKTISGFLRGQMLVCATLSIYYAFLLTIFGLPFGLLIGVITGILVIIPYVGWASSFVLALALAYINGGQSYNLLIATTGVYLFGQLIESYFLTPKMVGDRVGLHPLWLIFGMLAGAALLGFVGVLLSVPITAVIGVLTRFVIERYRESELFSG